jgi:hypothetical protein
MASRSSEFNDFLYATVGEDKNGMALTVLSALARQNVDPWEEAAGLSRLPGETAVGNFVAMLDGLPGFASLSDRTRVAQRLIPLLPHPPTSGDTQVDSRSPHATNFFVILTYLAIMLLGQWVMSGFFETAHDAGTPAMSTAGPAPTTSAMPKPKP